MKRYERIKSKEELKKSIIESVYDPDKIDFTLSETLQSVRGITQFKKECKEECKNVVPVTNPADINVDDERDPFFLNKSRMN